MQSIKSRNETKWRGKVLQIKTQHRSCKEKERTLGEKKRWQKKSRILSNIITKKKVNSFYWDKSSGHELNAHANMAGEPLIEKYYKHQLHTHAGISRYTSIYIHKCIHAQILI